MIYAFTLFTAIFGGLLGLFCLICVASIISHIVRRHVLGDRQQDLVRRINWAIKQHSNEYEIEALKYEEQNVYDTMQLHRRMIILNVVYILLVTVFSIIFVFVTGAGSV